MKTLGQIGYEASIEYWRQRRGDYPTDAWEQLDSYDRGHEEFVAQAVIQEHERRQWKPISEAPKDGTWVLLWWGDRVVEGHWLDNSHTQFPWAGWKLRSMVVHNPSYKPTHYRPLPAPPEGQ